MDKALDEKPTCQLDVPLKEGEFKEDYQSITCENSPKEILKTLKLLQEKEAFLLRILARGDLKFIFHLKETIGEVVNFGDEHDSEEKPWHKAWKIPEMPEIHPNLLKSVKVEPNKPALTFTLSVQNINEMSLAIEHLQRIL